MSITSIFFLVHVLYIITMDIVLKNICNELHRGKILDKSLHFCIRVLYCHLQCLSVMLRRLSKANHSKEWDAKLLVYVP